MVRWHRTYVSPSRTKAVALSPLEASVLIDNPDGFALPVDEKTEPATCVLLVVKALVPPQEVKDAYESLDDDMVPYKLRQDVDAAVVGEVWARTPVVSDDNTQEMQVGREWVPPTASHWQPLHFKAFIRPAIPWTGAAPARGFIDMPQDMIEKVAQACKFRETL